MTSQSSYKTWILAACLVSVSSWSIAEAGQTCGGTSPRVCVARGDLTSPQSGTDFVIDFGDSSNPDVTFKTGHNTNNWQVWSQVSAANSAPANLGDLRIDSTGTTDIYKVEIKNPNNNNPGAVNLLSAVLKDTTSWTGHSSIASGSVISGNLAGNVEVVASSGSGGSEQLSVLGNVSGNITAPQVSALSIGGDLTGDITIGALTGTLSVAQYVGSTSVIQVDNLTGGIQIGGDIDEYEFDGSLVLLDGIPSSVFVVVTSTLTSGSQISLSNEDLNGHLELLAGGSGTIADIDELAGAMDLAFGSIFCPTCKFSGEVQIGSIASSGIIGTEDCAGFDGLIYVAGEMAGQIVLTGDFLSAGQILVDGDITGDITVNEPVGCGETQVADGAIIADYDSASGGEITGEVDIRGLFQGTICGENLPTTIPGVGYGIPSNMTINFGCDGRICEFSPESSPGGEPSPEGGLFIGWAPGEVEGLEPIALRIRGWQRLGTWRVVGGLGSCVESRQPGRFLGMAVFSAVGADAKGGRGPLPRPMRLMGEAA